jgi:hypothetical protein
VRGQIFDWERKKSLEYKYVYVSTDKYRMVEEMGRGEEQKIGEEEED